MRGAPWARLVVPFASRWSTPPRSCWSIAGTPIGTSYAAESGLAAAADLAAGLGLLAAGVVALWARARSHAGALAALAGVAWFAPDWEAWSTGPPLVRSLGMVAAPFALAAALPSAARVPARRPGGVARWAVAAVYAGALVVCAGRALVRDPFLDPKCWRNCTDNVLPAPRRRVAGARARRDRACHVAGRRRGDG